MGALVSFATAGLDILLSGAKERAQEATSENEALVVVVTSLYQAMGQLASGYSNGSISQSQALADLETMQQSFWSVITPKIQNNRNGCSSGQSCPNANGQIPNGYCSGNIGAACCVGCGTIQKMFYDARNVLNSGSGTVTTTIIVASPKYNDSGFPPYTFTFTQPPASVVQSVLQSADSIISGNSNSGIASPLQQLTGSSNSALYFILAGAFIIALLLIKKVL